MDSSTNSSSCRVLTHQRWLSKRLGRVNTREGRRIDRPTNPVRAERLGRAPAATRDELERVRSRDPRALEAFYDQHFPRVHALARRLLGDVHAAEDLTQDIFFRVYRAAPRIDPTRDPVPWVMTMTYNACRDYWRSGAYRMAQLSRSIESDPVLVSELPAGAPDPEQQALAADEERRVQAAILALPQHLRAVVLLHDYLGLGHEEIASVIGASHAAARKRYSRALDALGRSLRRTNA